MKVLWLTNVPIGNIKNKSEYFGGGWLEGAYSAFSHTNNSIFIVFPDKIKKKDESYETIVYKKSSISLHDNVVKQLEIILKEYNPDVIHIWGTEYMHSLAMVKAAQRLGMQNRVVISIQGMVSIYALHYTAGIPVKYCYGFSFREMSHIDSIWLQKYKYMMRGKLERQAISEVNWVIGRTVWDKACTMQINSGIHYLKCNESLRDDIYISEKWNIDKCKKHSIFFSQAHYPIKGLHILLKALPIILSYYPDTKVYVAGEEKDLKSKICIHRNSYDKYIVKLCKKNNLLDCIKFLGNIDAKEMASQYRNANVFVCSSSIENSPNSVGEAMLIGVPTVAADVGGIRDLVNHMENGFVYPFDEYYMLAYYVNIIFSQPEIATRISQSAIAKGEKIHDRNRNNERLIEIYESICKKD